MTLSYVLVLMVANETHFIARCVLGSLVFIEALFNC